MSRIMRKMLRRSLRTVRYVPATRPAGADDLVAAVYEQVEREFGMLAPPIALHSPAPGPLAASWLMLRESLITNGFTERWVKETVAAEVSRGNSCPYCVAVHSTSAAALHDDQDVRDTAMIEWTRATNRRATASLPRPFPDDQLAELVGVIVTFHYLNRMVNVFLPDTPLPPAIPTAMQGTAFGLLGRLIRAAAVRPARPGASLDLLPAARLPDDMRWAAGNPVVAEAFARAAAAVDQAAVPDPVRALLATQLSSWDGSPPGISRGWLESSVSGLPAAHRPAGRLALLTAFASYQVDPAVVTEFTKDDRSLVELTSWASMAAARTAGSWIVGENAHIPRRHR
jgi:AhpD family alkylhydroperoxidase